MDRYQGEPYPEPFSEEEAHHIALQLERAEWERDQQAIAEYESWISSNGEPTYAQRVAELEREGLTRSDAQAVADAEQSSGRLFAFDPQHPAD